jgi:hypothetical protein
MEADGTVCTANTDLGAKCAEGRPSVNITGRSLNAWTAVGLRYASMVGEGLTAKCVAEPISVSTTGRGRNAKIAVEHPSASTASVGISAGTAVGLVFASMGGTDHHAKIAAGHPSASITDRGLSARSAAGLLSASTTGGGPSVRSARLCKSVLMRKSSSPLTPTTCKKSYSTHLTILLNPPSLFSC